MPNKQTSDALPENFKALFSFRLNVLTHRMSHLAALVIQKSFDLDPREWRILGILATTAPLSLQALANEIAVDKSQASKIVTGMIQRGLLQRENNDADGRSIHLSLTAKGRALYQKIFPQAVQRNEALLSVLSPRDRKIFDQAIGKLSSKAADMLSDAHRQSSNRNLGHKQGNGHD